MSRVKSRSYWGEGFCCCRACHGEFGSLGSYLLHLNWSGFCPYGADWVVRDIARFVRRVGKVGRRRKPEQR